MDKDRKIVFIIGNGFDLNTGSQDFLQEFL